MSATRYGCRSLAWLLWPFADQFLVVSIVSVVVVVDVERDCSSFLSRWVIGTGRQVEPKRPPRFKRGAAAYPASRVRITAWLPFRDLKGSFQRS